MWKGSEVGVCLACSGNKIMWVEWSKLGEEQWEMKQPDTLMPDTLQVIAEALAFTSEGWKVIGGF